MWDNLFRSELGSVKLSIAERIQERLIRNQFVAVCSAKLRALSLID
jgi:hypothetical protein